MASFIKRTWRSLPLPWRTNTLIGSDPQRAFLFFEAPPIHQGSLSRARRTVEYMNGAQDSYSSNDIPVQWVAWLTHTRTDPPTHEEILAADAQRLKVQGLAKAIDERDEIMRLKMLEKEAMLIAEQSQPKPQDGPQAWNPSQSKR
ncbi:hypothetical protein HDU98_008562 [Podochytrium sp. JEL0797]|nr:hypothetical protein HDU98_008562 [Podochytrium sp. JEL0797]